MSEKILLIDGHSILNRAFYGLPDLTNSEGRHTGAVYGFLNIMFKILEEEQPDYLTVAFDLPTPTFRHEKYADYKGNRKPMPAQLREQVPLLKEMLSRMGVCMVSLARFEADDLLGTLAKRSEAAGMDVRILSGDRDLLQLVTGKVNILLPHTVKGKTTVENFDPEQVSLKYQVNPARIVDLKALMGDAADNIPGVPGIGEKTATRLLIEFEKLDDIYIPENLESVKPDKVRKALCEHRDLAILSGELATIKTDCPLEFSFENARMGNLFTAEAYELCKRLDFKNLLPRFDKKIAAEGNDRTEFSVCTELSAAEQLFEKAAGLPAVGVALLSDEEGVYGLGISLARAANDTVAEQGGQPVGKADPAEAAYIPAGGFLTGDYLTGALERLGEKTVLCAMDVKSMLKAVSLEDDTRVFDAGVAAYLLNPLKSSYTYDELAREFLGGKLFPTREDLIGKTPLKKAREENGKGLGSLACYLAYTALACRAPMTDALAEQGMLEIYTKIERPLIFTLDAMEKAGIAVKGEELKAYGERLSVRIAELVRAIYQQAGGEFNINSPKQLGVVLFEKMKIPGGKKTKTGYSTSADILEKLAPNNPIIRDILEYRQFAKLKSTYADGLSKVIGSDGRIHSTFNQTITATGRISSTEPNLQNIPVRLELGRLIRKVFVPEEGFVFLDADYSQIELRVLAHMSGDEKLIQAYREAEDIHRLTASQVFHVPLDEVTPLQRRNAKAVNFGIVYGISSFGLSQDLSITRKEAADYIEKYFETYPKIKGFLDGLVAQGKAQGYVTTMFGRRRPIPELSSSNFMQRSFGERVAMNSPIQGTAADIIKIAMNRVYQRLKAEGLQSRLVLQVHDELLIETKKEEAEQVSRILREEMRGAAKLAVELDVDMHEGGSWYEAK